MFSVLYVGPDVIGHNFFRSYRAHSQQNIFDP